jgi:3-methyladenine DNA glycosylase Mpg
VDNHQLLTSESLHFVADASYVPSMVRTKRIGIDYAKEWKDEPLRFIDTRYVKK